MITFTPQSSHVNADVPTRIHPPSRLKPSTLLFGQGGETSRPSSNNNATQHTLNTLPNTPSKADTTTLHPPHPSESQDKRKKSPLPQLVTGKLKQLGGFFTDRIRRKVEQRLPHLQERGLEPISLGRGAPEDAAPPSFLNALEKAHHEPGALVYSDPGGQPFFRKAVAQWMNDRFGVTVNPKTEVSGLPGSNPGIYLLLSEILEDGAVMLPSPGYPTYATAARKGGHPIISVPVGPENNYMPDLEAFFQENKDHPDFQNIKALVVNYPSNPTGAEASLGYLKQVVDFAQKHQILIISDLAYSEIYAPGNDPAQRPHSIFEIPKAKDLAVEFHSLSKSLAITGLRAGFAVGRPDVMSAFSRLFAHMNVTNMPKPLQKAAAFSFTDPKSLAFTQGMREEYAHRRQLLLDGLDKLGWPMDRDKIPDATFFVWIPVPEAGITSTDFADKLLQESGVVVVPGSDFGPEGEGYLRLSLVQSRDKIQTVLKRLNTHGFHYSNASSATSDHANTASETP